MVSSDRLKTALRSPVRLWAALGIATVILSLLWLAIWLAAARDDHRNVRRWGQGGNLEETSAFAAAVRHIQDRGQWQAGARDHELGGNDESRDYALPHVSVYSVPKVSPAHARPTLRELGDRAQVRAIDAIEHARNSDTSPWDDLRKALSVEDVPGERDPFLFDRVLVATVTKGVKWPPGDRMVWTWSFVQPINFKFAAYTIAATENESVKVASVEATNVRKLSADIGLTMPGTDSSKVGLSPSTESTVKTTSDVSTQYERLGVDIMPSFLRIIRESGAGGDVIGNTTVALSMTTDPKLILAGSRSERPPPPEINLVVTGLHLEDDAKNPSMEVLPIVPLPHCALRARISAIYEQRHVQGGREFYDEARQSVVFIHDVDDERSVDVIGADDVSPFVWTIQLGPAGENPDNQWINRRALNARFGDGGSWRQLVFSDYGRAVSLAHWVRTHAGKHPSGYEFNWQGGAGLAVMKHTEDDCMEKPASPLPEPEDPIEVQRE